MTGADLIRAERARQSAGEGYDVHHDDDHIFGELLTAAVEYIQHAEGTISGLPIEGVGESWPWSDGWKPSTDPVRDLVKAGALIAAEIDRLQRARTVMR